MKFIVKWFIRIFFCKIFYRVEFINKENEEKLDKCLICPNHSNTLEPTWIWAKTPNLSIMAKAELFEKKILNFLYRYFDVFPIRRGEHDIKSLLHAINLFKGVEKKKFLVFPEGERIKEDRNRGTAKIGPVYIALKANVPIIPVYITKNAKLFSKVKIIYGEPQIVPKELKNDKEKLKEYAEKLLDMSYELGEKYLN